MHLLGIDPACVHVMKMSAVNRYVEEGDVHWVRSWEEAAGLALKEHKPVFLQFQEVPGCSNCTNYGTWVLKNPTIVQLIERYFVPCLVNNTGRTDKDAKTLELFKEPAWNNPVARLVDGRGKDLIPRKTGVYDPQVMLERILAAMQAFGVDTTPILDTLTEGAASDARAIYFQMGCYWAGEGCLDFLASRFSGVISTHSDWMGGYEVVEVVYDPDLLDLKGYIRAAQIQECFGTLFCTSTEQKDIAIDVGVPKSRIRDADLSSKSAASSSDQKYHLQKSTFAEHYPLLSEKQRITLNGRIWAARNGKAELFTKEELEIVFSNP